MNLCSLSWHKVNTKSGNKFNYQSPSWPFKPVPAAISSLHRSLLSCNMRLYRIGLQFIILARTGNGTKIICFEQIKQTGGGSFFSAPHFLNRGIPLHTYTKERKDRGVISDWESIVHGAGAGLITTVRVPIVGTGGSSYRVLVSAGCYKPFSTCYSNVTPFVICKLLYIIYIYIL